MKKILFMIPNLSGGGAELALVNLIKKIDTSKDIKITVLCLFNDGVHQDKLSQKVEYKYIFKKYPKGIGKLIKYFPGKLLSRIFIRDKYDLVVSYLEGYTTKIVSGYAAPKINWVHRSFNNIDEASEIYRNKKDLLKTYSEYDMTVFVSETAEDSFKKLKILDSNKSCVIYNSLDIQLILDKSDEYLEDSWFDSDMTNIISIGRFVDQKAFDRLIRIIKRIVESGYENVRLTILGTGKYFSEYTKLVKELSMENYINLPGFKENPYKYVKNSDIYICSSLFEGFSTAVSKALILGKVVVTTDCSGMYELLGDNVCGIITENNEEELEKGLIKILSNNELYEQLTVNAQRKSLVLRKNDNHKKVMELFEKIGGVK